MSPIRLRHVSLTHPQTPINRSLPQTFRGDQDLEVQKLCKNQASKLSRTSTPEIEEHSKQNHPNYLPRSQGSLELSSKASRNLTKHKSVKLYGFNPLKHRRTSTTNLQRRRMHQEREEYVKNTKNMKNKEFLTSL